MTAAGRLLGVLLAWGVASLWIGERWAWAAFQAGIFALAAWRLLLRRPVQMAAASLPLAAAALWPLGQLFFRTTIYPAATWSAALDWGAFLVVFLLARELLGDSAARAWFLPGAVLFGMAVAIAGTVGDSACPGKVFCVFESGFSRDVIGPFVNRNQYCAWVELLLPISLYLAAIERRRRVLFAAAAAVLAASAVASASRAGIVLVGAEIAAVALALVARNRSARRGLAWGIAHFLALAAIAIALVGWQEAVARWRNSGPEVLRQDALRASAQMIQTHPWAGSGLGTWSRVYPRYATVDQGLFLNQAHNDWAQWTAEGGLPFFFFLFFFAALLWKPAIRSIYGIGMVAFLLHALVDYPLQQRPALAAWFFCLAGVVCARRHGEAGRP